jgi:hypothetical protein
VAKTSSICDIWLLKLVPYTVELVPKPNKMGTGASLCSDAKLHIDNKITYPSTTKLQSIQILTVGHPENNRNMYSTSKLQNQMCIKKIIRKSYTIALQNQVFISHTIYICLASNGNRLANIAGTKTSACLQFDRRLAAGEAGALPGMRTPRQRTVECRRQQLGHVELRLLLPPK